MRDYLKNHTLAAGALLLTLTGIASRILGFFYRIFLSRTIGAEGLGVYQMVFPIYGICFSICAGSIQTAISRFTAADRDRAGRTLFAGFIISFSLALGLAAVIIRFSGFLASQVLMEPRCAPLLPAMALAIPCTSVHACLCGWYYGKEKVQVPALSQMVEQCIRIFTVFLIARIWEEQGRPVTVLAAVAGLVAGEAGSALFTLLSFLLFGSRKKDGPSVSGRPAPSSILTAAAPLLAMALPLMGNRLVMNLLQSLEAILIPVRLELSGLSRPQALSVYGVLTGMALPAGVKQGNKIKEPSRNILNLSLSSPHHIPKQYQQAVQSSPDPNIQLLYSSQRLLQTHSRVPLTFQSSLAVIEFPFLFRQSLFVSHFSAPEILLLSNCPPGTPYTSAL